MGVTFFLVALAFQPVLPWNSTGKMPVPPKPRQTVGLYGRNVPGASTRAKHPLFFRHQLVVDELEQLGNAELVHAGAMVVGFDPKGLVQAFGDANGDYTGGFFV